ncbi:hypothetical protein BZA77DRAFT_306229 [Pyronema omphalodes]|nr:hypothetical protein BZA77DRAFT_306229 [Pyronema omphalodes]
MPPPKRYRSHQRGTSLPSIQTDFSIPGPVPTPAKPAIGVSLQDPLDLPHLKTIRPLNIRKSFPQDDQFAENTLPTPLRINRPRPISFTDTPISMIRHVSSVPYPTTSAADYDMPDGPTSLSDYDCPPQPDSYTPPTLSTPPTNHELPTPLRISPPKQTLFTPPTNHELPSPLRISPPKQIPRLLPDQRPISMPAVAVPRRSSAIKRNRKSKYVSLEEPKQGEYIPFGGEKLKGHQENVMERPRTIMVDGALNRAKYPLVKRQGSGKGGYIPFGDWKTGGEERKTEEIRAYVFEMSGREVGEGVEVEEKREGIVARERIGVELKDEGWVIKDEVIKDEGQADVGLGIQGLRNLGSIEAGRKYEDSDSDYEKSQDDDSEYEELTEVQRQLEEILATEQQALIKQVQTEYTDCTEEEPEQSTLFNLIRRSLTFDDQVWVDWEGEKEEDEYTDKFEAVVEEYFDKTLGVVRVGTIRR